MQRPLEVRNAPVNPDSRVIRRPKKHIRDYNPRQLLALCREVALRSYKFELAYELELLKESKQRLGKCLEIPEEDRASMRVRHVDGEYHIYTSDQPNCDAYRVEPHGHVVIRPNEGKTSGFKTYDRSLRDDHGAHNHIR